MIDDTAGNVNLPIVTPKATQPIVPPVQKTSNTEDDVNFPETEQTVVENDDTWLDELTPYEAPQVQEPPQAPQPPPVNVPAEVDVNDFGSPEQQQNLHNLYKNLEHVEEEVADEVYNKLVAPDVQRLRAELAEVKQAQFQDQQAKRNVILQDINAKILAQYPKAKNILSSKQFIDYVTSQSNPYSTEDEFKILMRAYNAGDADYVLNRIEGFVQSRGKPKPPVGAEPQQGGGSSGVSIEQKGKPMSDAEYMAKRKAIKSAPRGTFPPNALSNLVNEYMNSRGN